MDYLGDYGFYLTRFTSASAYQNMSIKKPAA
jgi:hypothetical protein